MSIIVNEEGYPEYKKQEYHGNPNTDGDMYEEKRKRWERWEEKKKERYDKEVEFLKKFFPSRIKGTIIKLDCSEEYADSSDYEEYTASSDYKKKTGVEILDEETLIIGDSDNGICLIFRKAEGGIITRQITEKIHILGECGYDQNSRIHKWHEPTELPVYLRSLIIINNNTTINNTTNNIRNNVVSGDMINVTNNINNINISDSGDLEEDIRKFLNSKFGSRKERNEGIMYPIREMVKHSLWKPVYRDMLDVRRITICKSCRGKWLKGCCPNYSRGNRVMKMMAVGWKIQSVTSSTSKIDESTRKEN